MKWETRELPGYLPIHMRGPSEDHGPLPAFIYFALSGEESLHLDPFNQPIQFLENLPLRCYSFTLPFHGSGYDNNQAMERWAAEFTHHPLFLEEFLKNCLDNIQYLISQGWIDPNKIAVGGLSRGGFAATHLAAKEPLIQTIVGFAPLTKLMSLEELKIADPSWDLSHLIPKLIDKKIRFYMGNRDLRVNTRACFDFIYQLANEAYHQGYRSPPVELILSPSVGFKGHGTLPPIFKAGADWISQQLLTSI